MKSALLVACLGLAISASQLVQSSSYGGYGGASGGSDGSMGSGGASGGERPKVNLGISLKVPAMKINLGRMNMPRISIRAKIKQSHGPKVINVPEMHIDTNSKIPGPEGAHAAGGNGYDSSYGTSSYGSSSYGGSGDYETPSSSYGQSDSYSAPQSSYSSQPSSYEPQAYSAPQEASYGNQQSYSGMPLNGKDASSASYEPSYPSQAGSIYEPAASYDDSASPASYGNQNYATAQSGYMEAAPQVYHERPSAYQSTRSQYGASPNAYQAQTPYAPMRPMSQAHSYSAPEATRQSSYFLSDAPTSGYIKASSPATMSYSSASSATSGQYFGPSYGRQQTQSSPSSQYSMSGYSRPAKQYSNAQSYKSGSSPSSATNNYRSYTAQKQSSYQSPYAATNSVAGYQPVEAGQTMLAASNDNYDGLTRVTVASNPPSDSYYGQGSYGQQYYGQQPPVYQSQPSYQQSNYQSGYSVGQPILDDSTQYSGMTQGNYGSRLGGAFEQNGYIKTH